MAKILEWVAISFSSGSSQITDQTGINCIGRQIFYQEALGKSFKVVEGYKETDVRENVKS